MKIDKQVVREINSVDDFKERIYAAAVMYAKEGMYVLPLVPNAKRLPPAKLGISYPHASRNVDTMKNWFHPIDGKFAGYNIGLACGNSDGIVAIDVDIEDKKGNKGFDSLDELEKEHGKLTAPMQRSPRGGVHYVYEFDGIIGCSSSKLGKAIDTRGGDGQARGHIAAWPSMVDGEAYEWIESGDIEQPPEWIGELMGKPWDRKPQVQGRGSENVDDEDGERMASPNEIQLMLTHINIDELSYDEWLQVGQAIHSQYPNDEGLNLWGNWSKEGVRYEQGECSVRWHSFNVGGSVRMGTLVHMAKLCGFKPKPTVTDINGEPAEFADIMEEMNKAWGIVVVGGKTRIAPLDRIKPQSASIQLLEMQAFQQWMANQRMVVVDSKGIPKYVEKSKIWLADESRNQYLGGMTFRPDKEPEFDDEYGCKTLNTWRGWTRTPAQGDWSLMKAHILKVVCNGDVAIYGWLIDWMADLFQDPANPKGCALVLKGQEGTGKGTLIEAMGKTMGRHYVHVTQESHLVGNFNGHLRDALIIFADEVVYGGSRKTAGTLKALVSERNLTVEMKGLDAQQYRNCSRLAIASNEDWVVPAGSQSRRWLVLEVSPHRANDAPYFTALHRELDNGGYEAMMHELMEHEITNNLTKAPVTVALQEQRGMYSSRDSIAQWIFQLVMRNEIPVNDPTSDSLEVKWPEFCQWDDLMSAYKEFCNFEKADMKPANMALSEIGKFGFEKIRVKIGNKRLWLRAVPSREQLVVSLEELKGMTVDIDDDE